MKKHIHFRKNTQSGQMVIFAVVVIMVAFMLMGSLLSYTTSHVVLQRHAVQKEQGLGIAEAGFEMAIWKLNNQIGYSGETNTPYGGGTYTITLTDINSSTKSIRVDAYIPDSSNPTITKTLASTVTISDHIVAFHYGVQSGNGGFLMSGNGTTVNGNVYSNGNIEATTITGSAVAANIPATTPDQENDTPASPSQTIIFGNSGSTEDFAQSFELANSYSFNNIKFYIKKVGSPSNATVRILYDNNNSPGSAIGGLTGTLTASQVTSSYGWVTVTLPTAPILTAGVRYWMVIDGSSSASKYYILGANDNGYADGAGKVGSYGGTWNNTTPSGLDGYFQIYLGGQNGIIDGGNIGTTSEDLAWAHTVNDVTVSGPLYCQTGSGNNKSCNTSLADPGPQPLPLSDGNIADFKAEADVGPSIEGNLTLSDDTSLGPKKINGDLTITGGKVLTLTGTVWVTGNLSLSGGSSIQLDPSYGANDGTIILDGYVDLAGNSQFYGSGDPHSYPFVVTTSSCPDDLSCGNKPAIKFGGGSGTVGLVAQNGTVSITGGSALKAVTAKTISMSGGAELIYDSGLVNAAFSSGAGGGWAMVPGSYVIIR